MGQYTRDDSELLLGMAIGGTNASGKGTSKDVQDLNDIVNRNSLVKPVWVVTQTKKKKTITHRVEGSFGGLRATGTAPTKKQAKNNAAKTLMARIKAFGEDAFVAACEHDDAEADKVQQLHTYCSEQRLAYPDFQERIAVTYSVGLVSATAHGISKTKAMREAAGNLLRKLQESEQQGEQHADVRLLETRVIEFLEGRPRGLFTTQVEWQYMNKFAQPLPPNWSEMLKSVVKVDGPGPEMVKLVDAAQDGIDVPVGREEGDEEGDVEDARDEDERDYGVPEVQFDSENESEYNSENVDEGDDGGFTSELAILDTRIPLSDEVSEDKEKSRGNTPKSNCESEGEDKIESSPDSEVSMYEVENDAITIDESIYEEMRDVQHDEMKELHRALAVQNVEGIESEAQELAESPNEQDVDVDADELEMAEFDDHDDVPPLCLAPPSPLSPAVERERERARYVENGEKFKKFQERERERARYVENGEIFKKFQELIQENFGVDEAFEAQDVEFDEILKAAGVVLVDHNMPLLDERDVDWNNDERIEDGSTEEQRQRLRTAIASIQSTITLRDPEIPVFSVDPNPNFRRCCPSDPVEIPAAGVIVERGKPKWVHELRKLRKLAEVRKLAEGLDGSQDDEESDDNDIDDEEFQSTGDTNDSGFLSLCSGVSSVDEELGYMDAAGENQPGSGAGTTLKKSISAIQR